MDTTTARIEATPAGDRLSAARADAERWLQRIEELQARYRTGAIHVRLPPRFSSADDYLRSGVRVVYLRARLGA